MYYPSATTYATTFIEDHLEPPLLHGDETHQEWLAKELRKWIPDLRDLLEEYKNDCIDRIR